MKRAYIIDAGRTAIGKYGGALSSVRPDDLLATAIKGIIRRNEKVDPSLIEDVIAGDANQAGEDNRNVARMAALLAGLPVSVAGNTVNRLCASGLQSVMDAARALMCGDGQFYLAGGVESMSRAPYVMNKPDIAFSRKPEVFDTTIGWRFQNKRLAEMHHPFSMGETAENVAIRWQVSREAQDAFALESQEKYFNALAQDKWKEEIIPVTLTPVKGAETIFAVDEHPRKTSLEKLSQLKPAFAREGTVTAGNSSGINDGAAMLLLADEDAVKKYGLKPMAMVKSMAVAGVDPAVMGMGPVPATEKVLGRAGLKIQDMGLIELNEAFASQSIACIRELGLDINRVNVNGGAIALGHPLGCSGARIATTLLYEMRRTGVKYGLATMCVGVGQGAAMIFENCE
ncbi:MAG: acetyl-CoA C-acyltransferase [Chitinophagaceae bacterium]|nr:acetyl-CoA C-acyltransferase [Chitinophagaceae bacterium]